MDELPSNCLKGFKEACAEIVSCNCDKCQFWISNRDEEIVGESQQFVLLIGELCRMGNDKRIDGEQYCDAMEVVAAAVSAKSDATIVRVNKMAEEAMRASLAAHELN